MTKNFVCKCCNFYWFEETDCTVKDCYNCRNPVKESDSREAEERVEKFYRRFSKLADTKDVLN